MAAFRNILGSVVDQISRFAVWLLILGWIAVVGYGIGLPTKPEPNPAADVKPPSQISQEDYGGLFWALACSPDGKTLAGATLEGDVWIRDLVTSRSIQLRRGEYGSARSLAFSSDSSVLAVAGEGQPVRLWRVEGERPMGSLGGEGDSTKCVAFSCEGATLAVGHARDDVGKGVVTLWDWVARRRRGVLESRLGGINAMTLSPDGKTLVAGDTLGRVEIWDLATAQCRPSTLRLGGPVTSMAFSPKGDLLAAAAIEDASVRLWDATSLVELEKRPGSAVGGPSSLAFSPDGRTLAMTREDGTVSLWDPRRRREVGTIYVPEGAIRSMVFSADGKCLASGSRGTVRLWDVRTIVQKSGRPVGRG